MKVNDPPPLLSKNKARRKARPIVGRAISNMERDDEFKWLGDKKQNSIGQLISVFSDKADKQNASLIKAVNQLTQVAKDKGVRQSGINNYAASKARMSKKDLKALYDAKFANIPGLTLPIFFDLVALDDFGDFIRPLLEFGFDAVTSVVDPSYASLISMAQKYIDKYVNPSGNAVDNRTSYQIANTPARFSDNDLYANHA
jgi:hypothetical protein